LTSQSAASPVSTLNAEEVAGWLKENPNFLIERPDVLAALNPPDRGGGSVVDLQHAMVKRHREELDKLKANWRDLLALSRTNLSNQASIFEATLTAIRAASFEALIEAITERYPEILGYEAVTLCIETDIAESSGPQNVRQVRFGDIDAYLGGNLKQSRFIADLEPDPTLFGPVSGIIKSAALVRIDMGSTAPKALLAIGGREVNTFTPDDGDDLLVFLGQALGGTFSAWLDFTPDISE